MAFFNPFDVVTSGAKAVPGMPGMGPSQEAINAGKVNAPVGSLGALGGGMNGPQPVPGMPPQKMPLPGTDWGGNPVGPITGAPSPFPYQPIPGTDWGGYPIPTNPDGTIQLGGNRGSGQPINQPNLGMADNPNAPIRQPGYVPPDPSQMAYTTGMGSLQSLGGGPIAATVGNALVNLRGPDGSMKAVPQNDLAHWLSKGAVRV
jgi:hypothetical protein